MARLDVLHNDQLVGEHRIGPGKTIIGRTADNDIQIESRFISRHHAQVVSGETQSVVEDLNSTNGVFIRSQRIKHQVLADGDVIQLGEHKLLYRDLRGAAPTELDAAEEDEDDDDELDEEVDDEEDEEEEEEEEEDELDEELGRRKG
jgi:pSer/pThr/pTyr-binding forkhead associated (FHA) protein